MTDSIHIRPEPVAMDPYDLLTKAVGDISAALILAGMQRHITEWTARYVEAINQHDAGVIETPLYTAPQGFQHRVDAWMDVCFGNTIKADRLERCDRFIEEALELVQTEPTFTADRAHALVDYVFGRPVGEPAQEVGGVSVTLAALCNAFGIDVDRAAETELARVWTKVEAIRAKQAAKPTGSALPLPPPPTDNGGE